MPQTPTDKPPAPRIDKTQCRGRDGQRYFAPDALIAAANAALHLQAPLLLCGEPGCGKTDFAWAAATGLRRQEPLVCHVRSDTRAKDLLYHYDALRRFADSQHGDKDAKDRAAYPQPYIELQPLGEALLSPEVEVVLIDEIDKAPRDLPNDLLWELDRGGYFEIQEIGRHAHAALPGVDQRLRRRTLRPLGARQPLVIITSNAERQLPEAFLRRCVFYHIPFPEWPAQPTLLDILHDRFGEQPWLRDALALFAKVRDPDLKLTKRPATAELLHFIDTLATFPDLRAALRDLAQKKPREALQRLPAAFCLVKLREDLEKLGLEA